MPISYADYYNIVNISNLHSLCAKEIRDKLHVLTSLFNEWSVARPFECNPLGIWNSIEEGLNGEVLHKVISAVDQKRWDLNEVQTIDYTPAFQMLWSEFDGQWVKFAIERALTFWTYGADATVRSPFGPKIWSRAYQYSLGTGRIKHP